MVVGRGEEGGRVLGRVAGAALGELLDLVLLDLEAPGELAWKWGNTGAVCIREGPTWKQQQTVYHQVSLRKCPPKPVSKVL